MALRQLIVRGKGYIPLPMQSELIGEHISNQLEVWYCIVLFWLTTSPLCLVQTLTSYHIGFIESI